MSPDDRRIVLYTELYHLNGKSFAFSIVCNTDICRTQNLIRIEENQKKVKQKITKISWNFPNNVRFGGHTVRELEQKYENCVEMFIRFKCPSVPALDR